MNRNIIAIVGIASLAVLFVDSLRGGSFLWVLLGFVALVLLFTFYPE
jgi:hypothetical protein